MFKLGIKMWQLDNTNTKEVFQNAFLMRDKQFKVWWTPFHPRVEIVNRIQNMMIKRLGIADSFKKYFY